MDDITITRIQRSPLVLHQERFERELRLWSHGMMWVLLACSLWTGFMLWTALLLEWVLP